MGESRAGRLVARIDGANLRAKDGHNFRLVIAEAAWIQSRTGWLQVAVGIRSGRDTSSSSPLASGIFSGGGRGVSAWCELSLNPEITMADGSVLDARAAGLELEFVKLLGNVIPAGGHLMVEYESPGQALTHAELLLRIPPAATYLGWMMFEAGFRGDFKDWYISEGGHEGPRKLQANKSPTPAAASAALRAHRAQLRVFLEHPLPRDPSAAAIIGDAKARARAILAQLSRNQRVHSDGAMRISSKKPR